MWSVGCLGCWLLCLNCCIGPRMTSGVRGRGHVGCVREGRKKNVGPISCLFDSSRRRGGVEVHK